MAKRYGVCFVDSSFSSTSEIEVCFKHKSQREELLKLLNESDGKVTITLFEEEGKTSKY